MTSCHCLVDLDSDQQQIISENIFYIVLEWGLSVRIKMGSLCAMGIIKNNFFCSIWLPFWKQLEVLEYLDMAGDAATLGLKNLPECSWCRPWSSSVQHQASLLPPRPVRHRSFLLRWSTPERDPNEGNSFGSCRRAQNSLGSCRPDTVREGCFAAPRLREPFWRCVPSTYCLQFG